MKTLASARESEHPLEAIPIYERAMAAGVETKKAAGYQDAVRTLTRIEKLATSGGEPPIFQRLLARVVGEHGRKPTFMRMLHQAGWV